MRDVHKMFLTILVATIGISITAWHNSYIRGADVLLNAVFVGIAWSAFGLPWAHNAWSHSTVATWHRVAPRLYVTATVLAVTIPIVSLAVGTVITKCAPQSLDAAMAAVVCESPPPPGIAVTTLPRTKAPSVSACVTSRSSAYVAAGTVNEIGVAPAGAVLARVLGDIDSEFRVKPASVCAIGLLVALLFLWVVEIASDLNASSGASPSAGGMTGIAKGSRSAVQNKRGRNRSK